MNRSVAFVLVLLCCVLAVPTKAQTFQQWFEKAKTDIRLQPFYGYHQAKPSQAGYDSTAIAEARKIFKTDREASEFFLQEGFTKLYEGRYESAAYKFNLGWFADSTNSNVHWAFGSLYGTMGATEAALRMYQGGLAKEPNNVKLITDCGTVFLNRFTNEGRSDEGLLHTALFYLRQAYKIDPLYQNNLARMTACYYHLQNCELALRYYRECKALGGQAMHSSYVEDLQERCGE